MNDSLIEIALREMKAKRKPRTLAKITKDIFEIKGIKTHGSEDIVSQFEIDFMLSGHFICCGEDKNGNKLWDLKNRQPSSLLDKDGNYLEDLYNDDDEVAKNELKDDIVYKPKVDKDFDEDYDVDIEEEEDEEVDEEEKDDIEEELMAEDETHEETPEFEEIETEYDEEDEPIEDDYDDEELSDYEDNDENVAEDGDDKKEV